MDRRKTLKTLLIGTVAGATLGSNIGCRKENPAETESAEMPIIGVYGRTPEELEHDAKVMAATYLTEAELTTIAILCDIILPATPTAGSATDAKVPDFIEFIVKDLPTYFELPMRGGLMWLDSESNKRFNNIFSEITEAERLQIIDDIAYPDPAKEDEPPQKPELAYGIKFFNTLRNLTLTGYYTTRMGLDDLGYQGNHANIWDGVPEEVLKDLDVDYDPEWLAKCVDQSKRDVIAEWDDEGNLIT